MRWKMVAIFIIKLSLITYTGSALAQIQVHFNNQDHLPEALICPGQKPIKTKVPTPTMEDELTLPSLDEISTALLNNQANNSLNSNSKITPLNFLRNSQQPIKIGIWGDSHLAANFFAEELIKSIGLSREEVSPSFFAANIGRAGVRLALKKTCLGGGWKYSYAYNSNPPTEFPIGMLRMQAKNKDSYLWLDFRANQPVKAPLQSLEILLAPNATGEPMTLGISVDDLSEESFIEVGNQERINIEADYPISTIKVRLLRGSLNLDGLIPHYTKSPKLIVDNLAIPGATFKSWTNLVQLASFKPSYDVAILAFGTNEGNNPKFDSANYQLDLQQGLTNFRRMYPSTACVLIGPTDRGILVAHHKRTKKGGKPQQPADLLKYAKVHAQISAIQASEASIAGCSFWDWQDAMGGIGSAYTWAYEKPPLMSKDLTHLTIPGYQKSARQFSSHFQLKSLLNP